MKELKRTETIEKVIGYEANDGTHFDSKEECEMYEKSAFAVVYERFRKLVVKVLPECDVFENYGSGSEEYAYYIIDIKNESDINVYNHFMQFMRDSKIIDETFVGKRILVGTGMCYDSWNYRTFSIVGTCDDLVNKFKADMEKVFADEKGDTDETE